MKITVILGSAGSGKKAEAIKLIGWKNCHWLTPATVNEFLMTTRVVIDEVTEFKQLERLLAIKHLTHLVIISSTMEESDFKFTPLIYNDVEFITKGVEYTSQEEKRDLWLVGVAAVTLVTLVYSFYLVFSAGR